VLPQVTTANVSTFTGTTAIAGGVVVSDGWSPVTDRGVYFGENSDPEISGAKMQIGSGPGEYESTLTNLKPNTTYFIKAYATNIKGTSLGDQVSFITKPGYDLPAITTRINGLTTSSASVAGNITYDGGAEIIARGICWSTTQNPNISGNSTNEGTGNGEFISNLTGLSSLTTYYIRAYATKSTGTSYSDQLSFTTQGTLTDIEGNQYSTQPIGNQIWMAENLKTTKLSDGTSIPNITDPALWGNLTSPAYCWYNNDEVVNKKTYGGLYNWYTVNTSKLCPAGWHVPNDSDWAKLITFFRGTDIAGGKLKNKSGWRSADNYSNNESGFSGLPGGFVSYSGFQSLDIQASWWFSTISESSLLNAIKFANSLDILDGYPNAWSGSEQLSFGLSIRCLKD
jgi:uncharacterized protein (TIGR02145 family)